MRMPPRSIIHESVAGVLGEMGIKPKSKATNRPNNTQFLSEQHLEKFRKVIKEDEKSGKAEDETDGGNPDSTTTVDNKPVGTKAKPDAVGTKVNTKGEPTEEKVSAKGKPVVAEEDKEDKEDEKDEKKEEKAEDKKEESKDEKKEDSDEKKDEPKDEEKKEDDKKDENPFAKKSDKEKADEAVKFWGNQKNAVIMLWEGKGGKIEAEVHGISETELAPFGGEAPALPPKYSKLAKDGGEVAKGSIGALLLYGIEGMSKESQEILTGTALKAAGWKPPVKGSGKKINVGGQSK